MIRYEHAAFKLECWWSIITQWMTVFTPSFLQSGIFNFFAAVFHLFDLFWYMPKQSFSGLICTLYALQVWLMPFLASLLYLLFLLRQTTVVISFPNLVTGFVFCTLQYSVSNCVPSCFSFSKKGKGKAIPLQAWTGPEGSRRLRLPDCKTISTRRL